VLTAVAAVARKRRARETSRLLWLLAPYAAAAILLVAVVVRWRHASPIILPAALVVACLAWVVVAFVRRHGDRVPDRTAALIDDEVHFGGELRSAAWFASNGSADQWSAFHLDRAATHLESADFTQYYPPVRAGRARLTTAAMVAVALVIAFAFPARPHAGSTTVKEATSSPAPRKVQQLDVEGLPPDLPQELEDLLAAIENGTLSEALARDAALLDALNKLQSIKDPQALAALARAMANAAKLGDQQSMKDLADRAKRDASMTPPSEIKDALDQLAKNLSDPDSEMASAGFEKSDETEPNGGVDLAGASQSARDASAIAGIGMIAISKQDSAQSDAPPGMGAGGTSGGPNGGGTMPEIASALRHEVIEAHEDDVSGDVHSEERRKTEHGSAATAFTGSAAGRSDKSRTAAPPPVPETRRAGIQTYFTRKQ
jgi:hypothetical protein